MRQYFQAPQFARVGKLFQDLPLEALDKAMTGFNEAYNTNVAEFNKTDAALSALAVSEADDPYKQEKLKAFRERVREFAENGEGFENATGFIGRETANILGDKELSLMQSNYKKMQEDEAIRNKLVAQGLTPIDARKVRNGTDNFQSITLDENGNRVLNTYQNGYMQRPEYDKEKSTLFDKIPARGSTSFVQQPDGSMKQVHWSGIRESDIAEYAPEALARYRSTDAYKTEMIDLQTQGYTPEEAEALIEDSVIAAGKERVGVQSKASLLGYENPNVTAAREMNARTAAVKAQTAARKAAADDVEASRKENRFIQQPSIRKETDPNALALGLGFDETSSLYINGYSNAHRDADTKNYSLSNYFSVEKGNSDTDGGAKMKNEVVTGPMSHSGNVQVFVTEDTGELFMTGDGSSLEVGKNVPDGERPRTDSYGRYYVKDKDGGTLYLKPMNVKEYTGMGEDNKGNRYYVKMNRDEEYNLMGAESAVNSTAISLGAPVSGGARAVDNFDTPYIEGTIRALNRDPDSRAYANATIKSELENIKATSSDETDIAVLDEVVRRVSEKPERVNNLLYVLYDILREEVEPISNNSGRSADMFTRRGSRIAPMINRVIAAYEDSRTRKQLPKEDITYNVMNDNYDAVGEFEE